MQVSIQLTASCLWCEGKIPISAAIKGKMLCSKKCLNELKSAIEKQHGKGSCGYDMGDVYIKKGQAK